MPYLVQFPTDHFNFFTKMKLAPRPKKLHLRFCHSIFKILNFVQRPGEHQVFHSIFTCNSNKNSKESSQSPAYPWVFKHVWCECLWHHIPFESALQKTHGYYNDNNPVWSRNVQKVNFQLCLWSFKASPTKTGRCQSTTTEHYSTLDS